MCHLHMSYRKSGEGDSAVVAMVIGSSSNPKTRSDYNGSLKRPQRDISIQKSINSRNNKDTVEDLQTGDESLSWCILCFFIVDRRSGAH